MDAGRPRQDAAVVALLALALIVVAPDAGAAGIAVLGGVLLLLGLLRTAGTSALRRSGRRAAGAGAAHPDEPGRRVA